MENPDGSTSYYWRFCADYFVVDMMISFGGLKVAQEPVKKKLYPAKRDC